MATERVENISFEDVRNQHLLVALSGGADSVALLYLLLLRQKADGLRITAAHFHHGIRGLEADEDAEFCRQLCSKLRVKLTEGRGDVPALALQLGVGLETAARNARYAFLQEAMQSCGADRIALAHHMDDQAETVLMHLLRGAGPEGACGMSRSSGLLYRPLLKYRKSQLMQFLEARGISWREDASNGIPDTPRNNLRLNVLPSIERSYPSAVQALARFSKLVRIESDYLNRLSEDFLSRRVQRGPWGCRLMLTGGEEEALIRRALRKLCPDTVSCMKMDALYNLCRASRGKLEICGGFWAERTREWIYLLHSTPKNNDAVPLQVPGQTNLEGICRIQAEMGVFPIEPENPLRELADAESLVGAVLRTRRSGDRFHPLGAPGERLLSDYFIDRKLDRPLRDITPLLARGNRVLWVCGMGLSEDLRVTEQTRRHVRLTLYPIITEEKAEVNHEE